MRNQDGYRTMADPPVPCGLESRPVSCAVCTMAIVEVKAVKAVIKPEHADFTALTSSFVWR